MENEKRKKFCKMENLGKLRESHQLTPLGLATKIHVSREMIYKLESFTSEGSVETLVNIADFFGTSTDYVLGRTNFNSKVDDLVQGFSERDVDLLNLFHKLDKQDQDLVSGFIYGLVTKKNQIKKD